jgi:uncharacterized alpha-E superfamily protein
MLSRVAERIYWIGRYMERAENTARLVSVYTNLLLDLPRALPLQWRALIQISGAEQLFDSLNVNADEPYVVKFLLSETANSGSILRSVEWARENARTTREIMPSEVWEQINDFYLHVKDNVQQTMHRGGRHSFLRDTILACQQLNGMLSGTMSHDSAYHFARLGRNLERADMTSRILDVGSMWRQSGFNTVVDESQRLAYENLLWMSILRSLSGYQMYRQHVHNRINGHDVTRYLLQDPHFPRALGHCITEAEACIKQLPRNDAVLRSIARALRHVASADLPNLATDGLHEFIDRFQLELADVHQQMATSWFRLPGSEASQQQTASE